MQIVAVLHYQQGSDIINCVFISFLAAPTFRINGGQPLPILPPPFNRVVYVHAENRGATSPLNILCLYGELSGWTITEGLSRPPLGLEPGPPIPLPGGSEVALDGESGIITISPAPTSRLTFRCNYRQQPIFPAEQIDITVVPGL